jgi:hypothetical protein
VAEETTMSETANGKSESKAVSKVRAPTPGPELDALCDRANNGDKSCLPEVRALLADGGRGMALREANGSPSEWLRRHLVEKACGKNVLIKEAMEQEMDDLQADLSGPNPTPIEKLLAERASICWFIVNRYEDTYVKSSGWSIDQAEFHHRKIDKAHARFLSALRTLAQVRKLAVPAIQLNIAKNQVNLAGSET